MGASPEPSNRRQVVRAAAAGASALLGAVAAGLRPARAASSCALHVERVAFAWVLAGDGADRDLVVDSLTRQDGRWMRSQPAVALPDGARVREAVVLLDLMNAGGAMVRASVYAGAALGGDGGVEQHWAMRDDVLVEHKTTVRLAVAELGDANVTGLEVHGPPMGGVTSINAGH